MNDFTRLSGLIDQLGGVADTAASLYKTAMGRVRLLESQFFSDQATIATLRARVAQLEAEQGLALSSEATDPWEGLMVQIANLSSALNVASTEALRLASLRDKPEIVAGQVKALLDKKLDQARSGPSNAPQNPLSDRFSP